MANAREIQSRIKSVQDTMKITNAMYMISSSKMKKAKKVLEDTEPYFYNMQLLLPEFCVIFRISSILFSVFVILYLSRSVKPELL